MSSGYRRQTNQSRNPKVLSGRNTPSLAKYIKSEDCKNVIMMLGAGVSTSAGIPDFRSPETGLYSNLARLNLPHPEAVFEINFFRRNPVPFYTLAHELYPGKFRPTITHSFIRLLAEKSLLHTCFTQNIDTLERRAGVPDEKIIEAHGSFASQRCIVCHLAYDDSKMKEHILQKKIAKCESCGGYVKPDIVFFGEDLPPNFISAVPSMRKADLLIVMGTSLTVHPFASLAGMVDDGCPRVLINLDRVGDLGSRADDVLLLGPCDDMVRDLCKELGWEDELVRLWNETEDSVVTEKVFTEGAPPEPSTTEPEGPPKKSDALKEIEKQFAGLALDITEEQAEKGKFCENDNPLQPSLATTNVPRSAASPVGKDKLAGHAKSEGAEKEKAQETPSKVVQDEPAAVSTDTKSEDLSENAQNQETRPPAKI